MRLFHGAGLALVLLVVAGVGVSQPPPPFCIDITTPLDATLPPGLQFPAVAPNIPPDVTFSTAQSLGNDQKAFDLFSWQSFIALNWPADNGGSPLAGKISDNPAAPRVWEKYIAASQVFKDDGSVPDPWGGQNSVLAQKVPNALKGARVLAATTKNVLSTFLQASFNQAKFPPIADVNGMYVFYEIRLNRPEYDYLGQNKLYNKAGQTAFLQSPTTPPNAIDSPKGSAASLKQGCIELKAMWKQLGPGDDPNKFYTIQAVRIDPVTHQPSPNLLPFGLVGLHIVTRTEKAPNWIWSTFEHVENAPDAPATAPGPKPPLAHYTFNDPAKPQPVTGFNFRPPTNDPVANPTTPTQITRVLNNVLLTSPWTVNLNQTMQGKLAGTVWANYRLLTTQWPAPGTGQAIPCHVTNPVAETYIQADGFAGSCMRCHTFATTAGTKSGQPASANFSYLLQLAK